MQPITTKREAKLRGNTSSEDTNLYMEDVVYDITQLFEVANKHAADIPMNTEMLIYENIFLQKRINELSSILSNIQANIGTKNKQLIKTFSDDESLLPSDIYGSLDKVTDYGVVKIPHVQEISKLYLTDTTGENHVPESLGCNIYESLTPINITENTIDALLVTDSNSVNMCDGNKDTFWLRRSVQDTSTSTVYFCIDLDLPLNIINHQRVNTIYLDPTPLSGFSILDIQYKTASNNWARISSYPVTETAGKMVPVEIKEIGNTMFCFQTDDKIGIRIYGKQENWFLENGKRNFLYGMRNVEVNYTSFKTEEYRSRISFTIPDSAKQFTSIKSVTPILAAGSENNLDLVHIHLLYVGDQEYNLGDYLPALTKTVSVEIGLDLSNGASPLLSGLSIVYESA